MTRQKLELSLTQIWSRGLILQLLKLTSSRGRLVESHLAVSITCEQTDNNESILRYQISAPVRSFGN
jgi:hypothetical protein